MSDAKRPFRARSIIRRAKKPVVGSKHAKRVIHRTATEEASGRTWMPRPNKRLFAGAAIFAVVALISGGVWLWQSPLLRVQHLEVRGNS